MGSTSDIYYITSIRGLDGAPIRAPVDNAPQAHGGLVHNFWKGPRLFVVDGLILVQSTTIGNSMRIIRNQMEEDLFDALEAVLQADGTWAWTPAGEAGRSLTVRNNVPLETDYSDNNTVKTFSFGLIAANPDF